MVSGLSVTSRDYNGTTAATIAGTASLSGVLAGDNLAVTGTPSTVFPSASAGSYNLTVSGLSMTGTSTSLYNFVNPTLSASIYKINQALTWAPTQSLLSTNSGDLFAAASTTGDGAITYSIANAGTTGCTVSGRNLSFTAAGTCTVRATAAATTNYNVVTKDVAFTVSWLDQTLTWNPVQSLIPSDTGKALTPATTTGNGAITYSIVNAGTAGCSVIGSTLNFTDAGGTCIVRATAARTSIYNAATKDLTFTVTRQSQILTWAPAQSLLSTDSGLPFAAATTTGDGAITYTVQNAGTAGCTVSGRSLSFTAEGSCVVRATAARTADFDAITSDITFTTTWLNQTLTWNPTTTLIPSDSGEVLSAATEVDGGAITYAVVNSGTSGCTVSNDTLTFTDAGGTCVVRATAARTAKYNAATQDVTFTISRLTQELTWAPAQSLLSTDSGSAFAAASSTGDGVISYAVQDAGTASCSVSGRTLSFTAEGTCTVRATAARSTDYDMVTRDITFTTTWLSQTFTWDPVHTLIPSQTGQTLVATNGSVGGGAISFAVLSAGTAGCSVTGTTLTFTDAGGTCVVRATAARNAIYNADSQDVTFTVNRLTQTVAWTPTRILIPSNSGDTFELASSTGDGALSYAVLSSGAAGCSVNGDTLSFTSEGTCSLRVTAARTTDYNLATRDVTFIVSKLNQVVAWTPTSTLVPSDSGNEFNLATTTGDGEFSYEVRDAGNTECVVSGTSLSFNDLGGSCVVRATAASTTDYNPASVDVTFTVNRHAQFVGWSPTLSWLGTQSGSTLATATTSADGELSYSVVEDDGPNCELVELRLIFTAIGTCTLEATASRTTDFDAASVRYSFIISRGDQRVTWNPTNTSARADAATITPDAPARSNQGGQIRYSVADAGATGCSVDASSGVLRFSEAGTCVVRATALQTALLNEASTDVRFTISPRPAVISAASLQAPTSAETTTTATPNLSDVTKPLTTLNGEIPELRGGRAMMLINGVEQQINVEAVSEKTLRAESADGLVLNLTLQTATGGSAAITDSNGSLILTPGSKYSFTAEGFAPDSEIVIWLFSTPKKLGTAQTNSQGEALAEIIGALNLEPGQHTLQVSGTHPDGSTRALMISVTVPENEIAQASAVASTDAEATVVRNAVIFGATGMILAAAIVGGVVLIRRRRRNS